MDTKSSNAVRQYVPGTSRPRESPASLRERMAKELKELDRLAAQGDRLRQLRQPIEGTGADGGQVRYRIGQQTVADAAGVILRTYQAYEGGSSDVGWDKLKRIAEFHNVDPGWIINGDQGPSQADRIEAKLNAIMAHLGVEAPDLSEEVDPFGAVTRGSRTPTDSKAPDEPAATGRR